MKTIELIDKYEIRQDEGDFNPPSYIWIDNTGELIRCKDCKWREHEWTPDRGDEYWCEFGRAADEEGNGFCSIAERKEE